VAVDEFELDALAQTGEQRRPVSGFRHADSIIS